MGATEDAHQFQNQAPLGELIEQQLAGAELNLSGARRIDEGA
jgi:hypothetical protein